MFGSHQKLYLQKEDIKFLQTQVTNAALKKLDLHLPKAATTKRRSSKRIRNDEENEEEDEVRYKVRKLVEKYIVEAFDLTKFSLVIDDKELTAKDSLKKIIGDDKSKDVDTKGTKTEIEAFDFALSEKLRKVYYEAEELTTSVTKKRATIPLCFKKTIDDQAKKNIETIERFNKQILINGDGENIEESSMYKKVKEVADSLNNEDRAELIKEYEESLEMLSKLKQKLPERKNGAKQLEQLIEFIETHQSNPTK